MEFYLGLNKKEARECLKITVKGNKIDCLTEQGELLSENSVQSQRYHHENIVQNSVKGLLRGNVFEKLSEKKSDKYV